MCPPMLSYQTNLPLPVQIPVRKNKVAMQWCLASFDISSGRFDLYQDFIDFVYWWGGIIENRFRHLVARGYDIFPLSGLFCKRI